MSNIINHKIGSFLIQAVNAPGELEDGISVFVSWEDGLVFCDNFGHDLHAAKEYIKRNSKGKIKVVDGEFYSK